MSISLTKRQSAGRTSGSLQRGVRGTCPECGGTLFNVHSSQLQTGIVECARCGHIFTTQPCSENRERLTDPVKVCPSNDSKLSHGHGESICGSAQPKDSNEK